MCGMKHLLRALLVIFFIGAIVYNQAISSSAIGVLAALRGVFALPVLLIKNMAGAFDEVAILQKANLENQSLRAEILRLTLGATKPEGKLIRVKVHASYPFNNKNSFTIALGGSDGVREGAVVLASPGIYLGRVSVLAPHWSEVRTVFDGSRETPVRVGTKGVAALLRGGTSLYASMIDKTKDVAIGDKVYTALRDAPYGLLIGEVRSLRDGAGGVFKEADIATPYILGDLSEVFIYVD